ncbi:MAG: glycerol-3-phosphate dehydrogenase/oxidase [Gammaproteobacteria bacterium]|nr:glycerol-3-phosphate dehydrogenase/oxidase [Gammaproteobacteria bacterium]
MDRASGLQRLRATTPFDILVIGGGATGLGIAVDAATRGLSTALVERDDFAKGTSSRATKLVHGGVRYLAQGNVSLVREALRERKAVLDNAPHLAQPLSFLMPAFGLKGRLWDKFFYGTGLKLYDVLAGSQGLGATRLLNRTQTLATLPGVRADRLAGAIQYWDGQFDDARFAVALARTAASHGATVVNHCPVVGLLHDGERVSGAIVNDAESGQRITVQARCVVNATGVWVDELRHMEDQHRQRMVTPSQGIHLVVDREFLPGDNALLVPKTDDGRVMFAVPWLGKVILGTTDTPRDRIEVEPTPLVDEVAFILGEAAKYLARAPSVGDVRSIWGGVRPLVTPPNADTSNTKSFSREHVIVVDASGLVTVTGGKWTTYRAMAEDVVDRCIDAGLVQTRTPCRTATLPLVGAPSAATTKIADAPGAHLYGTDADRLDDLPGHDRELGMGLTEAMVRFAVREESARTVEDVLARRARILFLDAAMAGELAPEVAQIIGDELPGGDAGLQSFVELSRRYLTVPTPDAAHSSIAMR